MTSPGDAFARWLAAQDDTLARDDVLAALGRLGPGPPDAGPETSPASLEDGIFNLVVSLVLATEVSVGRPAARAIVVGYLQRLAAGLTREAGPSPQPPAHDHDHEHEQGARDA